MPRRFGQTTNPANKPDSADAGNRWSARPQFEELNLRTDKQPQRLRWGLLPHCLQSATFSRAFGSLFEEKRRAGFHQSSQVSRVWPANQRGKPCNPRRWCKRHGSNGWMTETGRGKIERTFVSRQRTPCGASWLMSPDGNQLTENHHQSWQQLNSLT